MRQFKNSLQGFIRYLPLLRELVERDIKVRYRRSVLGLLWTVLNPLLMMTVMTVIFSTLFQGEIENFALYYLSGYILYTFVNESTTQALFSVVNNGGLIKKVYIPKYLFPISKVMSALVNLGFSFLAMLIVMLVTGADFHWTMILIPVLIVYLTVFCCGLGMVLTTLHVFFRDIGHLYGIVTLVWMYMTPMFYPAQLLVKNGLELVLKLNPLYHFIVYFRMLVLYGTVPGVRENLYCFLPAAVMLLAGIIAFYRKQNHFILFI